MRIKIEKAEMSSFRRKKFLILVSVLFFIALIIFLNLRSRREKLIEVTVTKVERQNLTSIVSASGEVKPKKSINISAHAPGRIIKIGVEEGQWVNKGQFLLQLDPTQYEANAERDRAMIRSLKAELIKAEAKLKKDESFYYRQKKLFDEKLISSEQLETAKAEYDISYAQREAILYQIRQAEASLQITLDNLSKTVYTSPIDGIITSLKVEEGEIAVIGTMNNPGTVLMTIADLSVMQVEVEVDETDVVGIKTGQVAEVRIDAYPERIVKGEVAEIGSSALQKLSSTEESKNFKVIIILKDPPEGLKPGLSASADIITATKNNVLIIPISALVLKEPEEPQKGQKKQEEGVYKIIGNMVKFTPIKKGIMGEMMVEIIDGLEEGEEIVMGPYDSLRQLKDGKLIKRQQRKRTF